MERQTLTTVHSAADRPVRSGNKRDAILKAAAALLEAEGYRNTSMESVASAVGIRKATLYHYFSGKEEILYWITEEYFRLLIARQEGRLESTASAANQLRKIVADLLELCAHNRGYMRAFLEHSDELSDDYRQRIAERRKHYEQLVLAVIEKGVETKEFRPVDARLVSLALYGMCNWSYRWYRPRGPLSIQEVGEVFSELLLAGIMATNGPATATTDPAS